MDELNIKPMDVDVFVAKKECSEVDSIFIMEPSSATFDPRGLFSETIFGEIGSGDRLSHHGYIELNTKIFIPEIFDILMSMKQLHSEIVKGTSYARFDATRKVFVKLQRDDPNADTGYAFFVKHVEELKLDASESVARQNKLKILESIRGKWFMTKYLVIPAGLREYREKDGRAEYDDINKYYRSMMEVASTMKGAKTETPIFDAVRYSLQSKANQIFGYLWDMYFNDNGFMQKKYSARSVVRATRNVLVAMDTGAVETNPEAMLDPDEVAIPLYQAMAMFMPLFKFQLKAQFFNPVFAEITTEVSLIDPSTYNLTYVDISVEEKAKFTMSDKIEELISVFRDDTLRHLPVMVMGADNKPYYLYLTYVKGDKLYIARSLSDMRIALVEGGVVDSLEMDDVKPLTYYEMYYQACMAATKGKYATITRYPVVHHLSIAPAKVHITTTTSSNKRHLYSAANLDISAMLPRYPIHNGDSMHGMTVHPVQLINYDADHDGDTMNAIGLMIDESNDECDDYVNSPAFYLDVNGQPTLSLDTELVRITLRCITR